MITIAAVTVMLWFSDLDDERRVFVLCTAAQGVAPSGTRCLPPRADR